jgi:hypothetical protein
LPKEAGSAKAEAYRSELSCDGSDTRLSGFKCNLLCKHGVPHRQVAKWEEAKSSELALSFIEFNHVHGCGGEDSVAFARCPTENFKVSLFG